MTETSDIDIDVRKGLGRICLKRPDVLNVITFDMVKAIAAALDDWESDPAVHAVFIEGAGKKAFCAGGDVLAVSEAGQEQNTLSREFFQAEYTLNRRIHNYAKPYIAYMDGVTMGGGVGISVHGSCRIATENTVFAMPETGIGLFPDVGGSWFLPRCPGKVGDYLGLTGERLKAADLLAVGLADVYLLSDRRDAFVAALEQADWVQDNPDGVVVGTAKQFAGHAGTPTLPDHFSEIEAFFSGSSIEDILGRLESGKSVFSEHVLDQLRRKSPTMLKVTLQQLWRGRQQDFDTNMVMEYRMVRRAMQPGVDFHEGVRALLIDKDKSPRWQPATLADVSESLVEEFFEAPDEGDLVL